MQRSTPIMTLLLAACSAGGAKEVREEVPAARGVSMPRPGRARGEAAVALNRACERCHEAESAEWRGSLHQRAHVEPAYQRSFAIEPLPFCRRCHVPEGDPMLEPAPAVGEMGVGCVTCHVVEDGGAVLAVPREGSRTGEIAPHGVVRDARFATADACASCHEFAFPGSSGKRRDELMQSTVSEHAESSLRATSCASCHMQVDGERRSSHVFAASRSPELMRAAVRVAAERISPTAVRVSLAPVGVGHALPTGDLFRRIEVSVEAFGPDNLVISSARRYLTRHFEMKKGGAGKRLVLDDRLTGERALELDLGAEAAGHPIAWRIGYQRVAHPEGAAHEDAVLEDDMELASGVIR
ncbi:MAG: hypothetical protein JNL21_29730 [Myxococcales bacterium]|nr:hypothetical protein [Myxococcales bacterium]